MPRILICEACHARLDGARAIARWMSTLCSIAADKNLQAWPAKHEPFTWCASPPLNGTLSSWTSLSWRFAVASPTFPSRTTRKSNLFAGTLEHEASPNMLPDRVRFVMVAAYAALASSTSPTSWTLGHPAHGVGLSPGLTSALLPSAVALSRQGQLRARVRGSTGIVSNSYSG